MNRRRFLISAMALLPAWLIAGKSAMQYYANPEQVGYLGWIDRADATEFITLDGSSVIVAK